MFKLTPLFVPAMPTVALVRSAPVTLVAVNAVGAPTCCPCDVGTGVMVAVNVLTPLSDGSVDESPQPTDTDATHVKHATITTERWKMRMGHGYYNESALRMRRVPPFEVEVRVFPTQRLRTHIIILAA
jgi:hypothetical protein